VVVVDVEGKSRLRNKVDDVDDPQKVLQGQSTLARVAVALKIKA
jgi:hypothetical protein